MAVFRSGQIGTEEIVLTDTLPTPALKNDS